MKRKEIQALIHLLDDPDTEISDVVTGNLRDLGTEIIPDLETAWENTLDHQHQHKIENIIKDIQFRNVKKNLLDWKESGGKDLLEGVCLVARYQYPDLETKEIRSAIKKISNDIWLEINNKLTALEKVRIINHFIFDVHKLSKNNKQIHSPRNSYINLVLESKKGSPLTLGIIYMLVAQNLAIPVYGINLPKIFIVAYMDNKSGTFEKAATGDVLFYINPYQEGAVLGRREIDHYLTQQKIEPKKSYYSPCGNEKIIERLLLNLSFSYEKSGFPDKTKDLQELMKILKQE